MSDTKTPSELPESPEMSNFMKLARALFRVDKRDVPKHEVKHRSRPNAADAPDQTALEVSANRRE